MPVLLLKTEKETQRLAIKLAKCCPKNQRFIIFLSGELGAGKTYFVRAFIKSFGYPGLVKSPTYTLVETYEISLNRILRLISISLEQLDKYSSRPKPVKGNKL